MFTKGNLFAMTLSAACGIAILCTSGSSAVVSVKDEGASSRYVAMAAAASDGSDPSDEGDDSGWD
jgi:hypothetical protein